MKRMIILLVLLCLLIPAVFAAEPAWEYDAKTKTLTVWDERAFADADDLKPYQNELEHLVFGEDIGALDAYTLRSSEPETVTFHGAATTWSRYTAFFGSDAEIYGQTGSFAEAWAKDKGRTFHTIADNTWTKDITESDRPALNQNTDTMTIRTARELAWVAWTTRNGDSLEDYTLEVANDIDLSGKVWLPIDNFGGVLDGNGHTISGLVSGQGGLVDHISGNWSRVRSVFLQDAKCALWEYNSSMFGNGTAENCGFTGRLWFDGVHTLFDYTDHHNVWCAAQKQGKFHGVYCAPNGDVTTMNEADMKKSAFLTKLNHLMDDAWNWVAGTDGFPVLTPEVSRSWCNNTEPVTPQNGIYYIETAEELAYMAQVVNSGNPLEGCTIELMDDLDLSGKYWTPIGVDLSREFLGTFDGNGHTIRGLLCGTKEYPHGTAGLISSGREIHSVYLDNAQVSGSVAGALAAFATKVYDCGMKGKVYAFVGGGLLGGLSTDHATNENPSMERCFAISQVIGITDGNSTCGGLAGETDENAVISNCYAIGTVTSGWIAGGLVGRIYGANSIVQYCYASCTVDAAYSTPGLFAGECYTPNLISCFWCSDNEAMQEGILTAKSGIGRYSQGTDPTRGRALARMKDKSTFTGWNFNSVWNLTANVNGGLPQLRAFEARDVQLTKLTLSEQVCTVRAGETYWLTANVQPLDATTEILWSSSNTAVVKVSANGKLTALKTGTAVITAAAGKYSAACTVIVTEQEVVEFAIAGLTAQKDGAQLNTLPAGSFSAVVELEKPSGAEAVVVLAAYSADGQLLRLYFPRVDAAAGGACTVEAWIDNSRGNVGALKAFLLTDLSAPVPLTAAAELKK